MIKTVGEFVALVSKMREAQRQYFRYRSDHNSIYAKNLEKEVDRAIDQWNKSQAEKVQPSLDFQGNK